MLKVKKRRGKRNTADVLREKVKTLNNATVDVGHFQIQGNHTPSGMPYPDLMKIHHYGAGVLQRRVLSILEKQESVFKKDPKVKASLDKWARVRSSQKASGVLLDSLGDVGVMMERKIIGSPYYLQVTDNPTPLKETGELRANVATRNSINRKVRVPKR